MVITANQLNFLLVLIIILVLVTLYLLNKYRFKQAKLLVYLIFFLLAFIHFRTSEINWQQDIKNHISDEKVEVSAKVNKVESEDYGMNYQLKLLNLQYQKQKFNSQRKIILRVFEEENSLEYGDLISFETKLEAADSQRNPGGFCYYSYLKQRNIIALASLNSHQQLNQTGNQAFFLLEFAHSLRQRLIKVINNNFISPNRYLIKALILGRDSNLPQEINTLLTDTGLNHLFVVSGFHIGLIATLLYLIADKLKFSFKAKFILTSLGLFSYLLISGFKIPGLRAAVLLLLIIIGDRLGRKVDIYNLLAIIAAVMLVLNPQTLFMVSFQLSFAAVLAIVTLSPKVKRIIPIKANKIKSLLAATLSAQLGLLPILAYYFHQISIIGIITNLIAVPVLSLVIILSFVFLLTVGFTNFFSQLLVVLIEFVLTVILAILSGVNDNLLTTILVGRPRLITIALYYLILYQVLLLLKKELFPYGKRYLKKVVTITLAILIILVSGFNFSAKTEIIFFDVGQGDAILIKLPQGKNILVDTGETGQEIKTFLLSRGIREIDYFIASHFHFDHVGGFEKLAKEFTINKVIYPPRCERNELKEEVFGVIERKDLAVASFKKGDNLYGDNFGLETLAPEYPLVKESYENNNSLVQRFSYGEFELLLTGDIEREAEKRLARKYNLSANLLKAAHHGSNSSNIDKFIRQVEPKKTVIQVGDNNYGHPSPEVIARFKTKGVSVLRNDKDGAVIFTTNGKSFNYETFM